MPGSAKPRKLYKPQSKAGHQPLPRSVCTEFEGDLRFGLMALEHAASDTGWERVGAAINVIGMAHYLYSKHRPTWGQERAVIDGAVVAMNDIEQSARQHGAWFISAEQARCIYEGINVLVDRLPSFTAAQICAANTEVREQQQRHKERAAA